ncbi:SDR family NAD(P)-dependent oxidoreductase [Jannaschia aquimarina]|nr:SDR family oxidoreductase [Jannaschia aquimarina]
MDQTYPALVTGASRGLGAAIAKRLAHRFHVVAVARTQGGLEELDDAIQQAGGQATLAPMDVTDAGAMQHLCRSIHDRWGGLAVWAHTAITPPPLTPADMVSEKDMASALKTNVTALARLIPYVSPLLRAAGGGDALFFDDEKPAKFAGPYNATKAAQRALVQAWQAESTADGAPRIHLLRPEPMPTAIRARFHPGEDKSRLATPMQEAERLLEPLGF